jgi:hypothetical protein
MTTNGGGRSKRKGVSARGPSGRQRGVGDGRGAHQEHDGGGSGLGDVVVAPDFLGDVAAAGVGEGDRVLGVEAPGLNSSQ